jgi:predicted dehydrogenase
LGAIGSASHPCDLSMPKDLLDSQSSSFDVPKKEKPMIRFGVIGYGYWGPNVVRNLRMSSKSQVEFVCDKRPESLRRVSQAFPEIKTALNAKEIIDSPDVDAVAVVTPVWTHYELAKAALLNGKHVFVEKPFTSCVRQAEELIEIAERKNLKIMVDHTFLYTGAVRKIRQLIDDGSLGQLYYYDSMRVNLGLFNHDVNVVWDLASHDLSIMDYLIDDHPVGVSATGQAHLGEHEDIAFMTVYFPDKVIAHINVNWLSPVKVRTTLIGGEKKMLVWNDLNPDEKIKVYDKGVDIKSPENVYELLVSYRSGDMWAPHIEQVEALTVEIAHFIDCIENNKAPVSDGQSGLQVVKILEAAQQSIQKRGELVYL